MILVTSSSFGGNGSSGGGNIFGNQLNPWFLGNTKTVSYCVEISPEFSDVSRTRILELVSGSFNYWKKSFASSTGYTAEPTMGTNALLGTQEFVLQDKCDRDTDITFQLGFLNEMQKKAIPNYKQLVGIAYRTSYDEVNLKGKGFIYIGAESGDFRPMANGMHPKPWSYGKNWTLSEVMKHELGHVFGLQDDYYEGFGLNLMGATFAEGAIKKQNVEILPRLMASMGLNEIPSTLGCNSRFEGRSIMIYGNTEVDDRLQEVLDHLEIHSLGKAYEMRSENNVMKLFDTSKTSPALIGEVKLNTNDITEVDVSAVTLYLTKKQKVFKKDDHYVRYNETINLKRINRQITVPNQVMRLKSGKEIPAFITFNASCSPKIGTIINGKIIHDIFY